MGGYHLGIDFGTSSTVAVLTGPDGRPRSLLFDSSPLLSSAVYVSPDGTLFTGADAERAAVAHPANFEANPKRRIDDTTVWLGDIEITVSDLIATVLRRVSDEARRVGGGQPASVLLTHPAGWSGTRLGVLAGAAAKAGLGQVTLVPEPVAAAAYFAGVLGRDVPPGRCLVVYDMGAGTFDVAVVRRTYTGFEVLASAGLNDVGGLDLDAAVVAHARARATLPADMWGRLDWPRTPQDQQARHALWRSARDAKEQLSRHTSADVVIPLGDSSLHVTRDEFNAAAQPYLDRTVALTMEVLRNAQATREAIAGVILVGGSSRIPLAATLLHRALHIAPIALDQPELVVAEGSLYAAAFPQPAAPQPVAQPAAPQVFPATPAQAFPAPTYAPQPQVAPVSAPSVNPYPQSYGQVSSPSYGPPPPSGAAPGSPVTGQFYGQTGAPPAQTGPLYPPTAPAFGPPTGPTGPAFGPPTGPAFGQPTGAAFAQPIGAAVGQPTVPPVGLPAQPTRRSLRGPLIVAAAVVVVLAVVAVVLFANRGGGANSAGGGNPTASGSRQPTQAQSGPLHVSAGLVSTLTGHADAVYNVAFSPDGRTIATSGKDKTARLWPAQGGAATATLTGHTDAVYCVAFSPDGTTLATASVDKTVRLWDLSTHATKLTLTGHTSKVYTVAFSPDGKTIASGSADNSVRLWNAADGKAYVPALTGATDYVDVVAFSADGKTVAGSSADGKVRLWNVADRTAGKVLDGNEGLLSSISFDPANNDILASTGADGTIRLWNVTTGKNFATFAGKDGIIEGLAFSPDGRILAGGYDDGNIRLWDTSGGLSATGTLLTTLTGHTDHVNAVAWSPSGSSLASASSDKTSKVWHISEG